MYYFAAHYINMDNDTEITRTIKFEGWLFDSDKERYMYAMNKACDMTKENELLANLEFLAC